jgi:hypothetical protein
MSKADKLAKLKQVAFVASKESADLTAMPETKESRTAKVSASVKPSEKAALIEMLGRRSESDLIRELLLAWLVKEKDLKE